MYFFEKIGATDHARVRPLWIIRCGVVSAHHLILASRSEGSDILLFPMFASVIKKFRPGATKALTYRSMPSAINHRERAMESIVAENEICEQLSSDLLQRFPGEQGCIETLIGGYREFARTGITPASGYQAFRHLYWKTAGVSNDLIGKYISSRFPKPLIPKSISSIFGNFNDADIRKIASGLLQNGVYRLDQKLPMHAVQELIEGMDHEAAKNRGPDYCIQNADRTMYLEPELMKTPILTKIATDPLFYFVASEYLNAEPIIGYLTAWISRPHANNQETLSQRAQLFHADMSNPGFIKAFIYLNDVSETNGPHCVVPNTHREKAAPLWKEGRIDDEEMAAHYAKETWQVQTGGAGSVFFVDTSGFHKGIPLIEGYRQLVQFYYVNTLFGEYVPLEKGSPSFDPWRYGSDIRDHTPRFFARHAIGAES